MDGNGGSLAKVSSSESFHIPSESNYHKNAKGQIRNATGSVDILGMLGLSDVPGTIGVYSWSEHTNE